MKNEKLILLLLIPILSVGQIIKEGSRQIHLDFHTSGLIENIGENFSKEQFKKALKSGNVNSINIFGKVTMDTHTTTQDRNQHPHLKFDLLKEQIEACHEMGVTAQVYLLLDGHKDADDHPEWILKDKNGTTNKLEVLKKLGPN